MKKWFVFLVFVTMFITEPKEVLAETAVLQVMITTVNLNLREAPTTESTRLGTYPRGTAVQVIDWLDYDWYAVKVNGKVGYMKSTYLSPETLTTSDVSVVYEHTAVGAVEMLEWADAKKIFKTGEAVQVIDVRTKITYWVASFSNGKHADVEPVTPEDTAAMKRTYDGKWRWDPRPIWVMIDGRILAASINGMPHGGGINGHNNMNGQVCIHFKGSTTHNGNQSHTRDHQNAVSEAYNTAAIGW